MNLPARQPNAPAPSWMVWAGLWVVYIVWGSTYLAIGYTVETMPVLLSAGVRFLVAGAIVYLFLRFRRGADGVRVTPKEILASAGVGTLLLLGGNGLVGIAEQTVPSSLAALIIASVPLWVIVLRAMFADRASRGTFIGVAIGFLGVALLVLPSGDKPEGATIGGMLLLVAASVFWASGSFFSKKLPLPKDPFVSTGIQQLTGGVVLIAAGTLRGEFTDLDVSTFSTASILGLLYLITFGSLLAFTAYTWLLQNAPISKVATYAYVNPVIAIALGWFLRDEPITTSIAVGATVIVASVAFIINRESQESKKRAVELVPTPQGAEVFETT